MTDDVNFQHGINAKVVLDSVSPRGDRLTTIEATFHRFILAEVNTHRTHSRNSASSRAIPFRKQVARVVHHPAIPVSFPKEQRGMSGGEEIDDWGFAEQSWLTARDAAVKYAKALADFGVHKSVVNRLLEPFMWHTAILTATEAGWDNLFHQRCHKDAQPEFQAVARKMYQVYEESTPDIVPYGEWHLPYITGEDYYAALGILQARHDDIEGVDDGRVAELLKQVSAARCARVSYLTHDGRRSLEDDSGLYLRLVDKPLEDPVHSSPLEHVATPATAIEPHLGNLTGWHQLRHLIGDRYAQHPRNR
jgi:hypothetical protein